MFVKQRTIKRILEVVNILESWRIQKVVFNIKLFFFGYNNIKLNPLKKHQIKSLKKHQDK